MIENFFYEKAELIINKYKSNHNKKALKEFVIEQFKNEPVTIQNRILSEFFKYGPLDSILNNEKITEIIINGPQSIFYEEDGKIIKHNDEFYSASTYKNFIHLITQETRSTIDLIKPQLDILWNDFRLHLITAPISNDTCLTLRRNSLNKWNFEKLLKTHWASKSEILTIQNKIKNMSNILVIGTTGSGKTTILNCILQSIHHSERCIIIEDTDELICPNKISSKLLTRTHCPKELLKYNQADLLKESLRMRPHRIIVGEIRGSEAKDYLMALSTGHKGGLCSLHANSARQAIIRLEMLIQMGAPQWSLYSIRQLIQLSLDCIITVDIHNGNRFLKSIDKINSHEKNGILLENIFNVNERNIYSIR